MIKPKSLIIYFIMFFLIMSFCIYAGSFIYYKIKTPYFDKMGYPYVVYTGFFVAKDDIYHHGFMKVSIIKNTFIHAGASIILSLIINYLKLFRASKVKNWAKSDTNPLE